MYSDGTPIKKPFTGQEQTRAGGSSNRAAIAEADVEFSRAVR